MVVVVPLGDWGLDEDREEGGCWRKALKNPERKNGRCVEGAIVGCCEIEIVVTTSGVDEGARPDNEARER